MISTPEMRVGTLYEVTEENPDVGTLLLAVSVVEGVTWRCFTFLWLSGYYEGSIIEGSNVALDMMLPYKEIT